MNTPTLRAKAIMDNIDVAINADNREQSISHREEACREIEQLETELAEAEEELASIYATSSSEALEEANQTNANLIKMFLESQAREVQMQEALKQIYYGDIFDVTMKEIAGKALTQPAPPVVPLDDVKQLLDALTPLEKIYDAFLSNGLDEARPSWGDTTEIAAAMELLGGRGGKQLLTLGDCSKAAQIVKTFTTKHPTP